MPGESQQIPASPADPSVLTTEQLLREVDRVKELVEARLEGQRDIFDERLKSVHDKLANWNEQRIEQKKDTKDAVDAALAAAKEAVKEQTTASEARTDKSEATTTKSIDQLGDKFDAAFEGQRRDADDLKARVAKIESLKQGAIEGQGASSVMDDQLAIVRRELASLAEKVSKLV